MFKSGQVQIAIRETNLKKLHELESLYRRKIRNYSLPTTDLCNMIIGEMLDKLITEEKKSK